MPASLHTKFYANCTSNFLDTSTKVLFKFLNFFYLFFVFCTYKNCYKTQARMKLKLGTQNGHIKTNLRTKNKINFLSRLQGKPLKGI